ncbi:MAG: hypothetical protein AUJ20_09545 [Comamonadaceae bacterium CG1_02_60_18]|nr:MAG: hypothetical protein AUJ20_09545 [Comamonadaceae bacterium CG1_02_60_18]PIQ56094.1 MAG: hypothetical protein COW02_01720 [Comamonadaceae bacterium CG12_big_fil_rev_8_21_14_0_65_59_15]
MTKYVTVPLERVQLGKPIPVDVWSANGHMLLLRRGQALASADHRDKLSNHQACMTEADAMAWQRSLERSMRAIYLEGVDMSQVSELPLPTEIAESDYLPGHEVNGGWLDLQDILRGLLYQGAAAVSPLPRLQALEDKALALQEKDADEGLFTLFQTLPELELGYCATHALLCGLVSVLSAERLGLPRHKALVLMRAAMVMNIGMARLQDSLAQQRTQPNTAQRQDIDEHAQRGVDILQELGETQQSVLDLVLWHHTPDASDLQGSLLTLLQLLHQSDVLIAKMSLRGVRAAMLPLKATHAMVMQATETTAGLRRAMGAALGFYPPGTYVQLVNGETAVVISRGTRANTPHVASIINTAGMPMGKYVYRDTSISTYAVRAPLEPHTVHVIVNADRIRQLRQHYRV